MSEMMKRITPTTSNPNHAPSPEREPSQSASPVRTKTPPMIPTNTTVNVMMTLCVMRLAVSSMRSAMRSCASLRIDPASSERAAMTGEERDGLSGEFSLSGVTIVFSMNDYTDIIPRRAETNTKKAAQSNSELCRQIFQQIL